MFTTYASEPETATEFGRVSVATLPANVGAAGLLMLKTCSVFELRFTTYASEPETATEVG
jgi:hypothetical protein